jgi:hypothetical protein
MDIKETYLLGEDIGEHWYYQSKARAMTQLLGIVQPSILLDVGAGSGFFSRHLLEHTTAKEAWCVDISYATERDSTIDDKPIHYRHSIDANPADLVLLMDVLEHVDDDTGLLREYLDKVSSGTRFLITVPAFQCLWSEHDEFLEHKRRYTLNQLETVVRNAGLTINTSAYYFGLVFPLAAALRLTQKLVASKRPARSQLQGHHALINAALRAVCMAELPVMERNRLAGLTVFCLAHKT